MATSKSYIQPINAPTINAVSYASPTSTTIYFTPSTTSGVTDYQYSLDGITYTTTGYSTTPNYYFTINGSSIKTVHLSAVKASTSSLPSTFDINPSYISKGTIGGTGGGKVLFTPSYEYYVFTNTAASSTLTFSSAVGIEYLLVAAGGNGGSGHGGGGGAGGVLSSTASLSSATITVGSPATIFYETNPLSGNSTIAFNSTTITALGGAGGGSPNTLPSVGGGSGGGGGSWNNYNPSTGTAGQGNNGGYGVPAANGAAGGGGGGGAGGEGGIGSYISNVGGAGGAGGNGTTSYSNWIITISSYMNTVYSNWSYYTISGGIGYIASGGAGGAGSNGVAYPGYKSRTIGGGGGGGTSGAGGLTIISPTPGIQNTGGGGGGFGGNYGGNTAASTRVQGGSGIAIIRVPTLLTASDFNMYYSFTTSVDNNSGKETNTLTNTNVVISSINSIPCAYFNNSTSTSNIIISFQNYTNATFGYWLYYTGTSTSSISPLSIGDDTYSSMHSDLYNSSTIWFFAGLGSTNNVNMSSNYSYMNTWVHVTYTYSQYSPYTCSLYINGVKMVTVNGTGVFSTTPTKICLGKDIQYTQSYTGYMRDFFGMKYILTDSQIQYLYNTTKFF